MKREYNNIPNLNAYDEGVKKGADVALESEKLDIKKQNPFSPFFSPKSYTSFSTGLRVGFKLGISQREYTRLRELLKINNRTTRSRER